MLAKVYDNLPVARRFDPTTMGDLSTHYSDVLAALQQAQRLDPGEPLYPQSMADVQADAQRAALRRQQDNVAAANQARVVPATPSAAPPR